jgi:hypothetical protein
MALYDISTLQSKPSATPEGDRSAYWAKRRAWWAAEARRQGVDWAGINQTQIEVAAFLAAMRKR